MGSSFQAGGRNVVVGALKSSASLLEYERYEEVLGKWGLIADWWSFPFAREDLTKTLSGCPYIYAYLDKELVFRLHVLDFKTQAGSFGLESPWPRVTEERFVGKTEGQFSDTLFTFKTWLLVDSWEKFDPPINLNELERPDSSPISLSALRGGFAVWRFKGRS